MGGARGARVHCGLATLELLMGLWLAVGPYFGPTYVPTPASTAVDLPWRSSALGPAAVPQALLSRRKPMHKPAGSSRILFLGDSYTEGAGIDENRAFAWVVERTEPDGEGRRRREPRHEWACPFIDEMTLYQDYSVHYEPDVVVLVFVLNDLGGETAPGGTGGRILRTWTSSSIRAGTGLRKHPCCRGSSCDEPCGVVRSRKG